MPLPDPGREPVRVMVTNPRRRQDWLPAAREPWTEIDAAVKLTPAEASANTRVDPRGIISAPSASPGARLQDDSRTEVPLGRVTSPLVGTVPFGQAVGSCQLTRFAARCGQAVRGASSVDDKIVGCVGSRNETVALTRTKRGFGAEGRGELGSGAYSGGVIPTVESVNEGSAQAPHGAALAIAADATAT